MGGKVRQGLEKRGDKSIIKTRDRADATYVRSS